MSSSHVTPTTKSKEPSDIYNLNYNELRKEMKLHGLSAAGKKAELQERLKKYLQSQRTTPLNNIINTSGKSGVPDDKERAAITAKDTAVKEAADERESPKKAAEEKPKTVDDGLTAEQRSRMEENRKRALKIREMKEKKMKTSDGESGEAIGAALAKPVTPGTEVKNPYKKARTPVQSPPVAAASAMPASKPAPSPQPKKAAMQSPPPAISAWGDCRLDLWEIVCQCGGAREHSPDVRMCSCGAAVDAGLDCEGCGRGVLLIKTGPRGNFWGCSQYKKRGCKFTKRFGPPHDREAAAILAERKQSAARKAKREEEELSRIVDPFERIWRSECRCDGAKNLNTFECHMRSDGGCGFLPLCPNACGGQLYLNRSKFGSGMWWGCSNYRNGLCKFKATYVEHVSK